MVILPLTPYLEFCCKLPGLIVYVAWSISLLDLSSDSLTKHYGRMRKIELGQKVMPIVPDASSYLSFHYLRYSILQTYLTAETKTATMTTK